MSKNFFSLLLNYFFRGVLLLVPISATIYIIYWLLQTIDNILPFDIPGLGLLTLIFVLTVTGYIGSTVITYPLSNILNKLLLKAPLIKTIYTSIKDLLSAFVGKEKKFNQPVLVKLSKESNLEKIGFITQHDLTHLSISENKVAVYMPHSYAWSGNLFIVEKENIRPIETSSTDMMKFIISGGVSLVDKDK